MSTLNINGQDRQVNADPSTPILWALRDTLGMTGTKFGCGQALCGACTVQAPHSAMPQPNFVPVMPSVSRRAQRMGVEGSASTWRSLPLTLRVVMVWGFLLWVNKCSAKR